MISLPFRRRPDPTIESLYGMIVAQARSAAFYRNCGVPDTVSGRLEMVILHMALVLRRLRMGKQTPDDLGQRLFDHFCRDIDHSFREMGVGDLAVPKKMRRVAEAFYGRAQAYDRALDAEGQAELEAVVARNVFGGEGLVLGSPRLADYIRAVERHLSALDTASMARGEVRFPTLVGAVASPELQDTREP
jgi:cytochrome b pre-mRNA-processing protein 3